MRKKQSAPEIDHANPLLLQNLQQSRSFGSTFKFPESSGAPQAVGQAQAAGNAGFGEDTADDDLYA